jgi:hypothetical protein
LSRSFAVRFSFHRGRPDLIPEHENRSDGLSHHGPVVLLLLIRQFLVRHETGMKLSLIVSGHAVPPARLKPLDGPDIVRVAGERFQQGD